MDEFRFFHQQLDSWELLKQHQEQLRVDAREVFARDPGQDIAGVILTPDAPDAAGLREVLSRSTGQPLPTALLVGLLPRILIEPVLRQAAGRFPDWEERIGGIPHPRLPVLVGTRDGYRVAMLSCGDSAEEQG